MRSNWVARASSFTMGYIDFSGLSRGNVQVPVCTLSFDNYGKLESLQWTNVMKR
jgi:hypothetical protein